MTVPHYIVDATRAQDAPQGKLCDQPD